MTNKEDVTSTLKAINTLIQEIPDEAFQDALEDTDKAIEALENLSNRKED